ncbi:LysR family transcriptional regulator [Mesorhizobium sp. CC13]|uniref:LysR family transcriptional regulator n=1 Tax=Mesorhizobium sp. CC13 TaxID=3029194 RepID=UPI0032642617
MQIDPRSLIQLAEIVEQQSFSLAAKNLGTTQPALSKTVAMLEKRLGTELLAQRRRPVVPTEFGRQLAESGQLIRAALANAARLAADKASGAAGHLRIGAPPFICDSLFPQIVTSFRKQYPGVSFDITPAYSTEMRYLVQQNRIDIAFGPIHLSQDRFNLATSGLVMLSHAIVCRAGHPLLGLDRITVRDLEQAEWVSHAKESTLHTVMRDCLSSAHVTQIRPVVSSGASGAILSLLHDTDSLTVLPIFSVVEQLERGELRLVPFDAPTVDIMLGAITHRTLEHDPLIGRFRQHVETHIGDMEARARRIHASLTVA